MPNFRLPSIRRLAGVILFFVLLTAVSCKKRSNSFPTDVAMRIDAIAGNPVLIDVVSGGEYSATFLQTYASLYTTAGDLSLVTDDTTVIESSSFYLSVENDTAGLLCPGATREAPCATLYSTVPVYNATVSYAGGGTVFIQAIPAALKAQYLRRLAGTNDTISGTLFVKLKGHTLRGQTLESAEASTRFIIRDFPG